VAETLTEIVAGASKIKITPPKGVYLDGFSGRKKPSKGIHDDLFARAFYIGDGETSFAIVSCDLLWISQELLLSTKSVVSRKGTEPTQLMLCATHNHSGPTIMNLICKLNDKNRSYLAGLPEHLAESVVEATRTARPARIEVTRSEADDLSFNRRVPALPVDKSITLVSAVSLVGTPIAKIVNYACHAVVLGESNRLISADFPGSLTSFLESDGSICLYLNGACGDVNPRTCRGYDCLGTFDDVAAMGRSLANSVTSATSGSPVDTKRGIKFHRSKLGPFPPRGSEIELCVARIGELVILGVQGEVFAETGLAIRGSPGGNKVLIAGYTNGYMGYIPTEDTFRRKDYEASLLCWVDASAEGELRRAGSEAASDRV
jgi:hypothetical protein